MGPVFSQGQLPLNEASTTKDIKFDVDIQDAGDYYGHLVITITDDVEVNKYLGIRFDAPGKAESDVARQPWIEFAAEVHNSEVGQSLFDVKGKLQFDKATKIQNGQKLIFGIDGNLKKDPDHYKRSVLLAADAIPDTSGKVNICSAPAPDKKLETSVQLVTLFRGQLSKDYSVSVGKAQTFNIDAGQYTIKTHDLTTSDETTVAVAQVKEDTVTVTPGGTIDINVTYSKPVQHYSALDVTINKIPALEKIPELKDYQFHVIVENGEKKEPIKDLWPAGGYTAKLRRLPVSGKLNVSVHGITLNNESYTFHNQSVEASATLQPLTFTAKQKHIDPPEPAKLSINLNTESHFKNRTIPVRLINEEHIYTLAVKAEKGSTPFTVLVASGTYSVEATNFTEDSVVYAVGTVITASPPTAHIHATVKIDKNSDTLQLQLWRAADLKVAGFPKFLSFGSLADMYSNDVSDFVAAHASSVFKYSGENGNGDPDKYLPKDKECTPRVVKVAKDVTTNLKPKPNPPVLPVLVSYTADLSNASAVEQLAKDKSPQLAHSFANLIQALDLAQNPEKGSGEKGLAAAAFIVNPDFLGACQQNQSNPPLPKTFPTPVRKPLEDALTERKDYSGLIKDIPKYIEDNLAGHIQAVNWLVRAVAPSVTFGWQFNLWGVGTSEWIYHTDDESSYMAQKTAKYAQELGVFAHDHHPDFMAIDRYEGDDFTDRGYDRGYCFGPREWHRFYNFCEEISATLKVPVMPWQIPASHLPSVRDIVADVDAHPPPGVDKNHLLWDQHWGTGGSYLLGHKEIGFDYQNVHPRILDLDIGTQRPYVGKKGCDLFLRAQPFNLADPAYKDFPRRGIFSVLLGGGSTTGLVSSIGTGGKWTQDKLKSYWDNPTPF